MRLAGPGGVAHRPEPDRLVIVGQALLAQRKGVRFGGQRVQVLPLGGRPGRRDGRDRPAPTPGSPGLDIGAGLLDLAEERARHHRVSEVRLYTNEAMTDNLAYYRRHGYTETHQAEQDGFRRVFFRKAIAH
jgi:GNAT superfamily N-acetyltransferase